MGLPYGVHSVHVQYPPGPTKIGEMAVILVWRIFSYIFAINPYIFLVQEGLWSFEILRMSGKYI